MNFNRIILQRVPDTTEQVKDYSLQPDSAIEEVEQVEEVKVEEPKIETTVVETVVEQPVITTPVVEAPVVEKVVEKIIDWKETIKGVDKYDVLKQAGFDDFEIEMLKHKEATGGYDDYLEVKTVDFNKMTPEQILKLDFKKQNPGLSDKAIEFEFKKLQTAKYYTDRDEYPDDSDEATVGQEKLLLDAENKRKQFIEAQSKFKAPVKQPDLEATKREADVAQFREAQKGKVLSSPITAKLQQTKSISFGEGEASFNYPIANVDSVVGNAVSTIMDSDVKDLPPEQLQNFYMSLAIAADVPAFFKAYNAHIEAVNKKKMQTELQNVTPRQEQSSSEPKEKKDYSIRN